MRTAWIEIDWSVPGLRADEITLPGLLGKLGYRSAALGKWHLGSAPQSRPLAQGFDEFFGWYSGWLDAYSHRYYQMGGSPGKIFHDLWRNETEVFEEPAYMTELLDREAQAFLSRQKREQPFFLYLAFGASHYSMMAPRKYLARFPVSMERDRRTHRGMVAAADDVIGGVLDTLKRQGIEDETIVYFQADNGATREVRASSYGKPYTGGSNGEKRGYKLGLFDGGMHVPAILRAPGRVAAGQVWDRPMISMDLLPTLIARADPRPCQAVWHRWAGHYSCAAWPSGSAPKHVLELRKVESDTFWRLETDRPSASVPRRGSSGPCLAIETRKPIRASALGRHLGRGALTAAPNRGNGKSEACLPCSDPPRNRARQHWWRYSARSTLEFLTMHNGSNHCAQC